MEAKHTPTPWAREGRLIGGADWVRVAACHVGERDTYQNLANAELIIGAVNAHAALVEALRDAIEVSGFFVSGPTDTRAAEHGEPAWVCRARAALALVEER